MDLKLVLTNSTGIVWLGVSGKQLGKLGPQHQHGHQATTHPYHPRPSGRSAVYDGIQGFSHFRIGCNSFFSPLHYTQKIWIWGCPKSAIDLNSYDVTPSKQKGGPACWGSNEALSHAPSPSMQPAGQPLHAMTPGPRTDWEPTLFQHSTCTQRDSNLDPQHGAVIGCYGDDDVNA